MTSNQKGAIAEAAITADAIKLGLQVLKPVAEHERYDLAFDLGDRIVRVQCKWASLRDAVICVHTRRNRHTARGGIYRTYSAAEIDAVAAYCGELDRCYLLPVELIAGKHMIYLRLTKPRNGQRACITLAEEFELHGAVAQLGERRRGTPEATGSSPVSSTSVTPVTPVTVGAHEYRNHFGWYMERAAAGESFLITRRGKPCARLAPPHDQLEIPTDEPELEPPEPAEVVPITAASERSG